MFQRYRVKPSKSASVLGMIVGIIFIFIGATQMSHMGFFGVIWTLIALAITGYHAVNVFSNKGVSSYQVDVQREKNENNRVVSDDSDYESKLRQLHRLKEDDIISEEEYSRKKEEILRTKW
ncbi:SHOCT domain-containing protein [Gracilibacillus sp. YIM 98692]|uniref:SHOCT domain-containing protein n=1 Tax=Gracilibacillus sp. YIM 98692 TaxID=2663532 RepID=UPI0013D85D6A|nr:SHOCT domain-containing protein [Gracilibacillus sp. YIM 98692]